VIVEVEPNQNCDMSVFARFKEAGPARPVFQVRLFDRNPAGEWYRITGWSDDEKAPACPAYARLVEDSGSGLARLVYGGIHGLRLKSGPSRRAMEPGQRSSVGGRVSRAGQRS
jgi:hypothetical protein